MNACAKLLFKMPGKICGLYLGKHFKHNMANHSVTPVPSEQIFSSARQIYKVAKLTIPNNS